MKNYLSIIILIAIPLIACSQKTTLLVKPSSSISVTKTPMNSEENDGYPISAFSLSVNPIGFVQFGPSVLAEIGLTGNLVLNTHIRFPALGLLTYVVNDDDDGLDDLKGIAYGGGLIYFFGENKSKPYIGALVDYNKVECLYAENEAWEWWNKTISTVIIFNGGYRFRFDGGFFINTGAFFGAAINNWEWDYTDTSPDSWGSNDDDDREGTSVKPFGMVEVAFGIEF